MLLLIEDLYVDFIVELSICYRIVENSVLHSVSINVIIEVRLLMLYVGIYGIVGLLVMVVMSAEYGIDPMGIGAVTVVDSPANKQIALDGQLLSQFWSDRAKL